MAVCEAPLFKQMNYLPVCSVSFHIFLVLSDVCLEDDSRHADRKTPTTPEVNLECRHEHIVVKIQFPHRFPPHRATAVSNLHRALLAFGLFSLNYYSTFHRLRARGHFGIRPFPAEMQKSKVSRRPEERSRGRRGEQRRGRGGVIKRKLIRCGSGADILPRLTSSLTPDQEISRPVTAHCTGPLMTLFTYTEG